MPSCFKREKNVPKQSENLRASMFVSAAILWPKTVFLKIRHTLLEYPAPTSSSESITPKTGLVKLSQHSWRYIVVGTDFLHEAVFFLLTKADSVHLRNVLPHVIFIFFPLLSNCFWNPKSPNQSKVVLFIQRSKSSVWYNSMQSLRDLLWWLIFITCPLPKNHEGCRLKPNTGDPFVVITG